MGKITVIGAMVTDMVADVDIFPEAGETILGNAFNTYLGGKGFNQCVAARRLGGAVRMIGCVGQDEYGAKFLKTLDEEGICRKYVKVTDKTLTGLAQIQVDSNGQNKIVVIPAANHQIFPKELIGAEEGLSMLEGSDICILQLELLSELTFSAINLAHSLGIKVILNPAPAQQLPLEILQKVDYLVPNEKELAALSGIDTTEIEGVKKACQLLLSSGVKNVVTTLGGRGAMIGDKYGLRVIPAFKPNKIVDTVAAGDSFIGAFAVRLNEGAEIDEAVRFANAMGSLTVEVKGALPSLHNRAEVEERLKK